VKNSLWLQAVRCQNIALSLLPMDGDPRSALIRASPVSRVTGSAYRMGDRGIEPAVALRPKGDTAGRFTTRIRTGPKIAVRAVAS
jgi:hypothetical protein